MNRWYWLDEPRVHEVSVCQGIEMYIDQQKKSMKYMVSIIRKVMKMGVGFNHNVNEHTIISFG